MSQFAAKRLAVVGLGLIGGSLAKALRETGCVEHIRAYNRSAQSLQFALQQGIIDQACSSIGQLCEGLEAGDVLVLGVPVLAAGPVLEQLHPAVEAGVTITDVGSTKSWLVAEAERVFGEAPSNLVPAHPIAGSEQYGVEASRADLFRAHRVILTPHANCGASHLERVRELWLACGAGIDEMTPRRHDEVLGATSHLPHVLAYILVDLLCSMEQRGEVLRYAAGGFRDFTRIASSDPTMWRDIMIANREAISSRIDEYEQHLDRLKAALEDESAEAIQEIFERAQATREAFLKQSEQSS